MNKEIVENIITLSFLIKKNGIENNIKIINS